MGMICTAKILRVMVFRQIGQDDDHNPLFSRRTETTFAWTDVMEKEPKISTVSGIICHKILSQLSNTY